MGLFDPWLVETTTWSQFVWVQVSCCDGCKLAGPKQGNLLLSLLPAADGSFVIAFLAGPRAARAHWCPALQPRMCSDPRDLCHQQGQSSCRPARGRVCTSGMMLKWCGEREDLAWMLLCIPVAVGQRREQGMAAPQGLLADWEWCQVVLCETNKYINLLWKGEGKNKVSSQHWFKIGFLKDPWLFAVFVFDFFFYFFGGC